MNIEKEDDYDIKIEDDLVPHLPWNCGDDPFSCMDIINRIDFKMVYKENGLMIKYLVGEFMLNLVQHNFREHGKEIDIRGFIV